MLKVSQEDASRSGECIWGLGPLKGKVMGAETEWRSLSEMGKPVPGGEWIPEVEVGLAGAAGRLDSLSHGTWSCLSSFLRSLPFRRLFWHWEWPALRASGAPAPPQWVAPEDPFSSESFSCAARMKTGLRGFSAAKKLKLVQGHSACHSSWLLPLEQVTPRKPHRLSLRVSDS